MLWAQTCVYNLWIQHGPRTVYNPRDTSAWLDWWCYGHRLGFFTDWCYGHRLGFITDWCYRQHGPCTVCNSRDTPGWWHWWRYGHRLVLWTQRGPRTVYNPRHTAVETGVTDTDWGSSQTGVTDTDWCYGHSADPVRCTTHETRPDPAVYKQHGPRYKLATKMTAADLHELINCTHMRFNSAESVCKQH